MGKSDNSPATRQVQWQIVAQLGFLNLLLAPTSQEQTLIKLQNKPIINWIFVLSQHNTEREKITTKNIHFENSVMSPNLLVIKSIHRPPENVFFLRLGEFWKVVGHKIKEKFKAKNRRSKKSITKSHLKLEGRKITSSVFSLMWPCKYASHQNKYARVYLNGGY